VIGEHRPDSRLEPCPQANERRPAPKEQTELWSGTGRDAIQASGRRSARNN
jgi:hypothetical protein